MSAAFYLLVPFVNYAFCLLLTSGKDTDLNDLDKRREADHGLDLLGDPGCQVLEIDVTGGLHIDTHGILAFQMRNTDLVFAGDFGEVTEHFFDLGREYIDALDLHHVIGTALDDIDAGPAAAAGALLRNDPGQVMGPVTDQGRALFDQSGDDDLAPLAVR